MRNNVCLFAVLAGLAIFGPSAELQAGASDYEIQPVQVVVKYGTASELAIRLIHRPTGKPVSGAVLFRTRLDMGPDEMAAMTAKHVALPAFEPGVYRFKADLTMAGGWALRIMAKVQGEKDTIEGVVVFKAQD